MYNKMSRLRETNADLNYCRLCLNAIIKTRNLQCKTYGTMTLLTQTPPTPFSLLCTSSSMFLTPLVRFSFNKFFENYNNIQSMAVNTNMIIFCFHYRIRVKSSSGIESVYHSEKNNMIYYINIRYHYLFLGGKL